MIRVIAILATFAVALLFGACGSGEAPPAEESQTAASTEAAAEATDEDKQYEGSGKIESIDENKQGITIAHREIPGLMAAMTMTFSVDDPTILEGLEPGMEVKFHLEVTASRYIVVEISQAPA